MSEKTIVPYLFFGGNCHEAIEFYKAVLDAEIEMLMHFKDSPDPIPEEHQFPGYEEMVMHATLRIGKQTLMLSDGCQPGSEFKGFSLSISLTQKSKADEIFNALSEGGEVQMPLEETFWSPYFGMTTDRFGVGWMINVEPEEQK